MSLVHFTLTNPGWIPTGENEKYLAGTEDGDREDVAVLSQMKEDEDNPMFSSLVGWGAATQTTPCTFSILCPLLLQSLGTTTLPCPLSPHLHHLHSCVAPSPGARVLSSSI